MRLGRTQDELRAEIDALTALLGWMKYNTFGSRDACAMIEAQIQTLREKHLPASLPVLDTHSGDVHPTYDAAVTAMAWLAGQRPAAPSLAWKDRLPATEDSHDRSQSTLDDDASNGSAPENPVEES